MMLQCSNARQFNVIRNFAMLYDVMQIKCNRKHDAAMSVDVMCTFVDVMQL
jgi:hypothetical protein